jgi:hypothetical protein
MTNSLRIRQRWLELLPVVLLLGIYLVFPSLARQSNSVSQDPVVTGDRNKPKVKITAIKGVLDPGTLRLHVEILNDGARTLLISNEISGFGCGGPGWVDVAFLKGPALEGPGVGCAADCFPGPNKSDTTHDLKRLLDSWIVLSPGYSYGRDISSHSLRRTGRYLIRATYKSSGFAGTCWDDLRQVQDNLPYRPWTGEASSNSIWIEVKKPSAQGIP